MAINREKLIELMDEKGYDITRQNAILREGGFEERDPLQHPSHTSFKKGSEEAAKMSGPSKFLRGVANPALSLMGGILPSKNPITPLAEESNKQQEFLGLPGKVGRFMGEALPYLGGGNMGLMKSLLKPLIIGATKLPENYNKNDPIQEQGIKRLRSGVTEGVGGLVGELGGRGLFKGLNTLTGQGLKEGTAKEVSGLAKKYNQEPLAYEYLDTLDPRYGKAKSTYETLMGMPLSKARQMEFDRLKGQTTEFENFFEGVTGYNYKDYNLIDPISQKPVIDAKRTLSSHLKGAFLNIKKQVSKLYDDRDDILETVIKNHAKNKKGVPLPDVDLNNFANTLNNLINNDPNYLNSFNLTPESMKIVNQVLTRGPASVDVRGLFKLERELKGISRKTTSKVIKSNVGRIDNKILRDMIDAIDSDKSEFLKAHKEYQPVLDADEIARRAYREEIAPRNDIPQLRKLMYEKASQFKYENIMDAFLNKKDIHSPKILMDTLKKRPAGIKLAKAEALNDLYRKSFDGDVFMADKFVDNLNNLHSKDPRYNPLRVILKDEMPYLDGLAKILNQSYNVGTNVKQLSGSRAPTRATTGTVMSGLGASAGALSGAPMSNVKRGLLFAGQASGLTNLYFSLLSTNVGRKLYLAASKLKVGDPGLQKLSEEAHKMTIGFMGDELDKYIINATSKSNKNNDNE